MILLQSVHSSHKKRPAKVRTRTTFEIWINGTKSYEHKERNMRVDYKVICDLRKMVDVFINGRVANPPPFAIYKCIKSNFPPAEEDEVFIEVPMAKKSRAKKKRPEERPKMVRPAAEYSNHSPLRIAK
jgi:hypothetical protein